MQNNKDTSKEHSSKSKKTEPNWLEMHALADDQLSSEKKKETMQTLKQDPQCLAEYETVVKLKAVLKKSCKPPKDKEFWNSICTQIKKQTVKKKNEVLFRRLSWAFAGSFVVFATIFGVYNLINRSDSINANDILLIASEPSSLQQAKVTPEKVEDNWMQKIIASLPIKIDTNSFQVKNVFTSSLKNKKIYQIYLDHQQEPIQLIAIEGINQINGLNNLEADKELSHWKIDRHHCVNWNAENHLIILTGNSSENELHQIAEKLKK